MSYTNSLLLVDFTLNHTPWISLQIDGKIVGERRSWQWLFADPIDHRLVNRSLAECNLVRRVAIYTITYRLVISRSAGWNRTKGDTFLRKDDNDAVKHKGTGIGNTEMWWRVWWCGLRATASHQKKAVYQQKNDGSSG